MTKVAKPGDSLLQHVTASWFNEQNKRRSQARANQVIPYPENPISVPCIADTGIDLACFDAANIVGPAIPYEDFDGSATQYATASVKINNTLTQDKWGIIQGPCLSGQPSHLILAGVTWANFAYTAGHTHIDVVGGALVSGTSGKGLILSPPEAPGKPGLILIQSGNQTDHFLFTLAANMGTIGALATISSLDDTALIGSFELVINTLNDFSHLKSGDRGICVRAGNVYYAIHPENITVGHVIALTSKLDRPHASTATAEVIVSGEPGVAVNDIITVYNTGSKVGQIGALGWAIKIGSNYWVVEINQYPLQSLIIFDDDTHTFTGAGTRQGKIEDQKTISISSWEAMSPHPFSFMPSFDTPIYNPYNLLALANDSGIVAWNDNYEDIDNSIYGRFELIKVFPATKRRLQFRLTADIDTMTVTAVEDFEIIQTREFTAGQVAEPSPKYLYDVLKLIRYGRTGDLGECEYSYREENWQITSFRSMAGAVLVKTPAGGLPARSGATLGSASCDVQKATGGTLSSNAESLTVYNPWPIVIPGNYYLLAVQEALTNKWLANFPGVLDVRYVLDTALEQTLDGTNYTNIESPELCS